MTHVCPCGCLDIFASRPGTDAVAAVYDMTGQLIRPAAPSEPDQHWCRRCWVATFRPVMEFAHAD